MMMPADHLAEYYPRGPAESKKIRDYAERCYEELDRSKAFLQSKASFLEFMKQVNDEILKVPSKRPEILPNLTIIGPPAPPAPPAHPVVEESKLPLSSQSSLARLRELRESFEHSLHPRKTSAPPSTSMRQQPFETLQFTHPPPSHSSSSPLRERRRKETSQTVSDTPPSSQPYNPSPTHDPVIRNRDIQRKGDVLEEKKVVFSPRSDHTLERPHTPPSVHPSKQDQQYASDPIANPTILQRDNSKDTVVFKEEVREDGREEKEEIEEIEEEYEEEDEVEDEVEEEEKPEEEIEGEYTVDETVKPSGFHKFTSSALDFMKGDQETGNMPSNPITSTLREIESQQPTFPSAVRADEDEMLVRRDPLSSSFSSSLYPPPYQSVHDSHRLERTREEWERSLFNEERRERILKEIDQTAAKNSSNYSYHPPSIAPSLQPPPYAEPRNNQSKLDAYIPAIHIHNHVVPSPPTFPSSEVNFSELKMSDERESSQRVTSSFSGRQGTNTVSFEGSDGFSSSYPRLRFALRSSNSPSESVDLSSLSLKRIRELNGLD